jgi:hypothetical protein
MSEKITIDFTFDAYLKLLKLDRTLIGGPNYMGVDYFWHYEYRHYLRDASEVERVRVHKKLLKAGLKVDGCSKQHEQIIIKEVGE